MGTFDHFQKQDNTPKSKTEIPAAPPLKDFHPYDTGLSQTILALSEEFSEKTTPTRKLCNRTQFIALLAGISALRKTPGIPGPTQSGPNYFTTLPRCASPETAAECRAHLEKVFGITDRQTLLEFCKKEICCHHQYLDFVGFWENHPPFDIAQLNKNALDFFQVARNFSAQFYTIVGHKGYLAWDISECMGHLRAGYACGLLTWDELSEMAEGWIIQAQTFQNWADFAVSLVCGELYWDFRHGSKLPELNKGLNLWVQLIRILLDNDTAWGSGMWYDPTTETTEREQ